MPAPCVFYSTHHKCNTETKGTRWQTSTTYISGGHLFLRSQCCAVDKPLHRMELCPWGETERSHVIRTRKKLTNSHDSFLGERVQVSENSHIASHKPPMFLCSVFQEDYCKAFCQGLEPAAVQNLPMWLNVDTCRVPKVPWLSCFPTVEIAGSTVSSSCVSHSCWEK